MPLPRWLARSNKHVANRLLIGLANRPPFGAIRHVGRSSGTEYRIPINAFRDGPDFVVALTYGSNADWVKNVVAAGGGTIEHGGSEHPVTNPRIVGPEDAMALFPAAARIILRAVGVSEFLRLEVTSRSR